MTRRPGRAVGLLLAGALACVAAALAGPGEALASDAETVQVSVGGAAFSSHPTGVLLDVDGLVPGTAASGTLAVRSAMHTGAALTLQLVDTADDDNGCVGPEVALDTSCGPGGGELGRALRFSVAVAGSARGAFVERWSGTGDQLRRAIDARTVVGVGATTWVRLTATLPSDTGNVVQSDTFRFGVRVVLHDVAGSGVAGVAVHNAPGGSGVDAASGSRLSLTGTPVLLLVGAATLLLVAGGVALTSGRRRAV